MKIGDVVVRAPFLKEGWKEQVPGIIVDKGMTTVSEDGWGPNSYDEVMFTVSWSDNSITRECSLDLELLEEALS